jgi:hypothetical protein
VPETSVIPASSGLDTLGIGNYKPPTFRQAVSFQRSIGAPRATINETQTLPLTAKCQDCGCMIAAFAVVLCERMSALPQFNADGALVVLARNFRASVAGLKSCREGEARRCRRSIN